ncbi:Phosphoglycerate kinase [bioreactor metagenome]|jgi:phosphoglycerate kinase|uniref:phosphoglycerate kinase n=1 Tax=bioreactor metagenome TaxID=1076179 RepID=A0A644VGU3_9ZZZZ|nr:phosphoglycerate kinase [Bacteroidaceae bacterium]MEA5100654.1 phosphoglycerate kinase [Bacteroidales bacterium]NCC18211.1 phosphoglycerate kinase [Bacteroidia bacterium]
MKSIKDINFKGKKVLVRVDFNVPLDERKNITDDTRMRESMPTINKLLNDGAAVIIMAHFGRPKKGGFEAEYSLNPVAKHLSEMLNKKVMFTQEVLVDKVAGLSSNLEDGDVMLLENIRFYPEETKGDVAFAEKLAKLGDAYVNDAFGAAHREHASTATIARFFPNDKYFGFLMENEVRNLQKLMNNPSKPFTAIVGGSKVSSKIDILKNLAPIVDNIIIGGGMTYTFLKAMGINIGTSICEEDKIDLAKELIEEMKRQNTKLILPIDHIIADKFENEANKMNTQDQSIPDGFMGMDIGEKSIELFKNIILESKTILWNGPMGVFEMPSFAKGTFAVAEYIAKATKQGGFSAVGGGDSVAAINQSGFAKDISYISTGGGAMLEYLEGKTLPGIKAILD